jgi:hypothetical protein
MADQEIQARDHDSGARHSRRNLLAASGAAAVTSVVAGALAHPMVADAANGDPVLLGQANPETTTTTVSNGSGSDALSAVATGTGRGLEGRSTHGIGVNGRSGPAASALSIKETGVHGITGSAGGYGVVGENTSSDGIAVGGLGGRVGVSGNGLDFGVEGVAGPRGSAGVHGTSLGPGPGVLGDSDEGIGVAGSSMRNTGVVGESQDGVGVHGGSSSGIGVLATGKTALRVDGHAVFSRSGILTVPAGHSSVAHPVEGLTPRSMILVTLQEDLAGTWIRSAVPAPESSKFTVHLNHSAPAHAKVAWLVID